MKFLKFSFVIILINSCANIVSLTGGKDDTQVPVLIKKNYDSIHFNQKKIELKFNEYVTLNQPEKNITLQPSHSTLKFKTLQKSVIIELDSQLKNNTTYVLTIDKGIQDNNANNPFSFTSVFSTGGQLDTGIIKVKLLNNLEQIKNIKIALTNSSGIDSFKSFKPDYIYSMTNNQIAFNGLSNKLYNIWSFYDDDNNNIPDVYKPIDFRLNALIDSNYTLMLKEWKKPLYIKNLILDKNTGKCILNQTVLNLDSTILKTYFGIDLHDIIYLTTDSFTFNVNDKTNENLIINKANLIQHKDTSFININKEKNELMQKSIQIIKRKSDYLIQYNDLKNTTSKVKILNKIDTIFIINNDTINIKNTLIKDYKNLSYFDFKINSKKIHDIYLYLDKKLIYVKKYNNQITDYFVPGKYEIKIIENDKEYPNNPFENKNGGELILTKEIILKANWDEVLSINL